MTQTGVLQFVIVGQEDHPLYDADLSVKALDSVRDVSTSCLPCFSFWVGK